MVERIDSATIDAALELRRKIDTALDLGYTPETIGAALMVEKGLDPGKVHGPIPLSLDSMLNKAIVTKRPGISRCSPRIRTGRSRRKPLAS